MPYGAIVMTDYDTDQLIRVRAILIEVASQEDGTISYSDLAKRAGLQFNHRLANDRRVFGLLLGDVSRQEYARGRPLLTAVVVRKGEGKPSPGFMGLEGFPETEEFWETELKRVHDFWVWR